ncbi:MAG: sugar phosphate isomerase/epimerase [Oscillospiraceae bacterium]|nr:sugar phosphate isomerase/epimerase [Oscillospiraceae bacterium]
MKIGTFMHQLFVMQDQLGCETLSGVLARPELAGLQCVDADSRHFEVRPIGKIKQQLDDAGIAVSSMYCDIKLDAVKAKTPTALADEIDTHLERCANLGTNIFMPVPLFNGEVSREDKQAQILDFLHMTVERSPQYGVTTVLENFSRQDSTIASIDDMKFYLDRVPELQYVLDTGSFWISQSCNPYDACVALLDRTIHVHLKDIIPVEVDPPKQMYGRGFDHAVTGEGILPIRDIIAELDNAGYDGTLSIELITSNEPLLKTQKSIHNLQQLI